VRGGADAARRAKGRQPAPRRATVPLGGQPSYGQMLRRTAVSAAIARRFRMDGG